MQTEPQAQDWLRRDQREPSPSYRTLILDLGEEEFQQWRHHPVTAAFLHFLEDQADNFRTAAADLWEVGRLDPNNPNGELNANVLRGRTLALRELSTLTLEEMRGFYQQSEPEDET